MFIERLPKFAGVTIIDVGVLSGLHDIVLFFRFNHAKRRIGPYRFVDVEGR